MKNNIDTKYLALSVISFAIVYGLMAGHLQQLIQFEDVLNEIAMAGLMTMLGIGSLFAAFEKSEK